MKRIVLFLLASFVLFSTVDAQDAKRDLRNAKRALSSFGLDPTGNSEKIGEAKSLIDGVVQDAEYMNDFEAWYVRGNVYNEMASQDIMLKTFNEAHKNKYPDAPMKAYDSYLKAYELGEKTWQKRDAAKGISEVLSGMLGYGFEKYQEGDQAGAFEAFEAALVAHYILIENNQPSPFAKEEDFNNQVFTVAVTAMGSGNVEAAEKYLNELREANVEKPEIYDLLYKLYKEKGEEEKARAILQTGRELYPDDVNLLFSEINQALQDGKLDELEASLQLAIEKEPNNLSLYATLGNVYDNLFRITEDTVLRAVYFDKAFTTFNQALEIDENHFDAIYSLGALYYNKAAEMTQELAELADDYSSAGLKKFEEKQKEVNEVFRESLPYFQKADQLNSEDRNTLIALKEIYARLNELEKSNQYKDRLEALEEQE